MHTIRRAGLIVLVLGTGGAAWANEEPIRHGEETFKINLGGILTRNDTTLRLDSSTGQSRAVDLEDAGLSEDSTGFLGSVTWRFASKHRIGIQTFSIQRSGTPDDHADHATGRHGRPRRHRAVG